MHNKVHLSWVWAQLDSASDIRLTFLHSGYSAPGYNEPLADLLLAGWKLHHWFAPERVMTACLVLPALSLSGPHRWLCVRCA